MDVIPVEEKDISEARKEPAVTTKKVVTQVTKGPGSVRRVTTRIVKSLDLDVDAICESREWPHTWKK